ncbi:MAG: hypothetical protein ACOCXG_05950 [Nanoarchaeota archaeon]
MSEYIEGFSLTGQEVKKAKSKDFEILSTPFYEEFQDGDKAKRRLKLIIKFNGAEVSYFPNRTSQAVIVGEKGRRLEEWQGFKGKFTVKNMLIGKEEKEVIYIE